MRLAEKQQRAAALRSQLDPSSSGYRRLWYRRDWRLFLTTPGFEHGMNGLTLQHEQPASTGAESSFYSETSSISPAQRHAYRQRQEWIGKGSSQGSRPSSQGRVGLPRSSSEAALVPAHRGAAVVGGTIRLPPPKRMGSGQPPPASMGFTREDVQQHQQANHMEPAPLRRPGSQPSLPPRRVSRRELPPKTPPMDIRLQTKLKKLNINQLFLEQSVVFNREV